MELGHHDEPPHPNLTDQQVVLLASRTIRSMNLGLPRATSRDTLLLADAKSIRGLFPNGEWLTDDYRFPDGRVEEIEASYDSSTAANTSNNHK